MKIKDNKKISRLPGLARDFIDRRRSLVNWALRFGAVLAVVVLLFSVFRYGIYLKEIGYTTYFNSTLKKLVKLDFSFVGNYAEGSVAELDEVAFDIKFKHMLRLQYLREQSLEAGFILPEFKNEEFPAKLTHNGKTIDVKIALTGLVAHSHLRNPSKWSFEVKVKGGDTFMGMKSFAMLLPSTRGYLTDWIGFELMKAKGLMGLRVDFVNVSFNGKSKGIFYLEERFDKYLVENNRMREGILFKIENGVEPYKEGKVMAEPKTREQLILINRLYQQVMAGTLPPGKLFDLRKMAQVFVICDLMMDKHPLAGQNLRYYFNPVTGLAEPIAREWEELDGQNLEDQPLFLEKPKPATRHFRFERRPFIRLIYDNLEFKEYYIQEAAEACQPQFLDKMLQRNQKKLDALMKKVYRAWPYYEDPTQFLYANQSYMRSVLFPEEAQLSAYFHQEEDGQLSIYLQNEQDMPLQVNYLSWRDSIRFYPDNTVKLDSRAKMPKGEARAYRFSIPEGIQWDESYAKELAAHYNLLGLEPGEKSTGVMPLPDELSSLHLGYYGSWKANYDSFDFIEEDEQQGALTIPAGAWAIDRDLAIPAGRRLMVAAGARIDLTNQARIISYSPVFFEGTEANPVVLHSSDETGRGLLVIEAAGGSYLYQATFDGLSGFRDDSGRSTAPVTFYRSPVAISSCTFSNNRQSESYLNVIRSNLDMEGTLFSNTSGGAVTGTFCTGAISNSSFANIGGDGIALRGSGLMLTHLFFNEVRGTGIRAGEESEVDGRWIELLNTNTAIAGADGARITLADSRLRNSDTGIAAYREKDGFGPAMVEAWRIATTEVNSPFMAEGLSAITLDGKLLPSQAEGARAKVDGQEKQSNGQTEDL